MGTAYDQMGQRPDAIQEYKAAEKADPDFMGVHSGLGFLYWRSGETDLAEAEVRAELQRFPSDPVSNCILGQILLAHTQLKDAETHFHAAIAANPRYTEAFFFLGRTELALNHPQAAVAALRKAIQIDPNYFQAHYVLGTVLRQLGQTAEATKEQERAVDIQEKGRTEAIKKIESH
jgi:tetratricopeptide (TPR) repeat protein